MRRGIREKKGKGPAPDLSRDVSNVASAAFPLLSSLSSVALAAARPELIGYLRRALGAFQVVHPQPQTDGK